jgi:peptidoglycan hydrolase CwlO-like protein
MLLHNELSSLQNQIDTLQEQVMKHKKESSSPDISCGKITRGD